MSDNPKFPNNVFSINQFPKPDFVNQSSAKDSDVLSMFNSLFSADNSSIKVLSDILVKEIENFRKTGDIVFVGYEPTVFDDPDFYEDEPVPEYFYRAQVWFKEWIIGFEFFGQDEKPCLDIASSSSNFEIDYKQYDGVLKTMIGSIYREFSKKEPVKLMKGIIEDEIAVLSLNRFKEARLRICAIRKTPKKK